MLEFIEFYQNRFIIKCFLERKELKSRSPGVFLLRYRRTYGLRNKTVAKASTDSQILEAIHNCLRYVSTE